MYVDNVMLILANFIIPEEIETEVRVELVKLGLNEKEALGIINLYPKTTNPEEIAKEVVEIKKIIKILFGEN